MKEILIRANPIKTTQKLWHDTFFFLEYFAYFQVCRYVQIQSEEVKKKKKRGHNMSRASYTKTLSLYFINSNTLANINYLLQSWLNQIAKQTKLYLVKRSI